MLKRILATGSAALAAILFGSCSSSAPEDPLPSWNDTPVKRQIVDFVENKTPQIPVEDRVAVFDMDGTIACEEPMWFEMAVSAQIMADKAKKDPSLNRLTEYRYAHKILKNPADTSVLNHWDVGDKDYMKIMENASVVGMETEAYVEYANRTLKNATAWNGMKYAELFYQPMLELIGYLKAHLYDVYIVSGSMQSLLWGILPEAIGFDRQHLIGTRQKMAVRFPEEGPLSMTLQEGTYKPRNNYYGKSINIYTHTGKVPVIAVGNTAGDFGMFHMASCSPHPHLALLLNHDDAEREVAYPPYYPGSEVPAWEDSLKEFGWIRANMSEEFRTVWKTK